MIVASTIPVVTIHGRRDRTAAPGADRREVEGAPCAVCGIAENDVGESVATGTSIVPGGGKGSEWGVESAMRVWASAFAYLRRGRSSSWIAGWPLFSWVTSVGAIGCSFATFSPRRAVTAAFTER